MTEIRLVTQIPIRHGLKALGQRTGQRGFALLLVLLMAAAVAFSLYLEMPRVGFESARNREQLLMDRGGQFKRAIEVYYAVNKKYPATLEDLEKGSDKRFLRHRYKDPLTGKDEWRLIHTNGSFLTDSLVKKPPTQNAQNGQPVNQGVGGGPLGNNNMNMGAPGTGASTFAPVFGNNTPPATATDPNNPSTPGQPVARNAAALRRPSDFTARPQVFDQNNVQQDPNQPISAFPGFNQPNYNPNDPSTWPPISLAPAGQPPGQTGVPPNGLQPNGFQQTGLQPGLQTGLQPGQPNPFGAPNNGQFNGAFTGQNNQFNRQQPTFPNGGFNNQNVNNQNFQNQNFPNQNLQPGSINQPVTIPGFGGQPQTGLNIPNPLGGQINGQPLGFGPDNPGGVPQPQVGIPGQFPGIGGANPQPNPFAPTNTLEGQGNSPAQQAAALAQQQAFNQNQITPATALAGAFPGQNANQQNNFNPPTQPAFNGQQPGAGAPGTPFPTAFPPGNQPQPANNTGNGALNAINQTLLGQNGQPGVGGNLGSPGIAGVASKFEGPSIMSYAEKTKYQEWEFVFDPSANLPAGQQQQNPQANPLQNQNGQQPNGNQPNPFGGPNPFGSPNSNGQPNPFGQPPQQQQGNGQSPLQNLFGPSSR